MAGSNYERILAAEWLVVMATETLDALGQSTETQFTLPTPSVYFATMVVYLMLAAVAMFGERPGRLAAAFGGVAGLAILIAPTSKGKRAPVVGALAYFAQLMKSGPNTQAPTSSTGTASASAPPSASSSGGPVAAAEGAAATAADAFSGGLTGIWGWIESHA